MPITFWLAFLSLNKLLNTCPGVAKNDLILLIQPDITYL